jgi:heme-degrading monooxygenase HmoA
MFVVIYRWKLKEGTEERFREGWRRATEAIAEKYGALGSRLHRAEDGSWLAYAQWPDKDRWQAMRGGPAADAEAFAMMRDSIDDSASALSPLFLMTVTDDHFKQPTATAAEQG